MRVCFFGCFVRFFTTIIWWGGRADFFQWGKIGWEGRSHVWEVVILVNDWYNMICLEFFIVKMKYMYMYLIQSDLWRAKVCTYYIQWMILLNKSVFVVCLDYFSVILFVFYRSIHRTIPESFGQSIECQIYSTAIWILWRQYRYKKQWKYPSTVKDW